MLGNSLSSLGQRASGNSWFSSWVLQSRNKKTELCISMYTVKHEILCGCWAHLMESLKFDGSGGRFWTILVHFDEMTSPNMTVQYSTVTQISEKSNVAVSAPWRSPSDASHDTRQGQPLPRIAKQSPISSPLEVGVCSSNINRSMEAHVVLGSAGKPSSLLFLGTKTGRELLCWMNQISTFLFSKTT